MFSSAQGPPQPCQFRSQQRQPGSPELAGQAANKSNRRLSYKHVLKMTNLDLSPLFQPQEQHGGHQRSQSQQRPVRPPIIALIHLSDVFEASSYSPILVIACNRVTVRSGVWFFLLITPQSLSRPNPVSEAVQRHPNHCEPGPQHLSVLFSHFRTVAMQRLPM